jgi:hypothetical protein
MKKICFMLISILLLNCKGNICKVDLQLESENNQFHIDSVKIFRIIIKNNSNEIIEIPAKFSRKIFESNDSLVKIEMEKYDKIDSNFIPYDENPEFLSSISYLPDYNSKPTELNPLDRYSTTINIDLHYNIFAEGEYRIRAISKKGGFLKCEPLKSQWFNFKVFGKKRSIEERLFNDGKLLIGNLPEKNK